MPRQLREHIYTLAEAHDDSTAVSLSEYASSPEFERAEALQNLALRID